MADVHFTFQSNLVRLRKMLSLIFCPKTIMINQLLSTLLIAVTLLSGCSKQKDPSLHTPFDTAKTIPVETTIGVQVIREERHSEIDEAVLSIVIGDLVTYQGEDAVVEAPMGRSEKIFIDTTFSDFSPSDDIVLNKHRPEYWEAIEDIDPSQLRMATENIRVRSKSDLKPTLEIADARILTTSDSSYVPKRYERPVRISLPGFSGAENLCVVFVRIPWSMHSADGTYVLQLVDGQWRVRLRQFIAYL